MNETNIDIERLAIGGEGVGRLDDGRVVFVSGTVPGDRVDVELTEEKKRYAKGRAVAVLQAGVDRAEPRCSAVAAGCGGCDWQHLADGARPAAQLGLVSEVLHRQGLTEVSPTHGGSVPMAGYRSTVRCVVDRGRAGFRRARSHDVVTHGACDVAVAALQPLFEADWGHASEVVMRAGVNTGDLMAIVDPSIRGIEVDIDGVRLVGRNDLAKGRRAWMFEVAAGRRWRISADSFFQSGPWAVELLVDAVRRAVQAGDVTSGPVADLYGGIGVFAGALSGDIDGPWTLVESSPSAIADAKVNLADLGDATSIIRSKVERWKPTHHDLVIADPPRSGLGAKGCDIVNRTGATELVLVSCDLGAWGRDLAQLVADGWSLRSVEVLDLFAQTSHVEVVSGLHRAKRVR